MKDQLQSIQILRAVAALAVLAFHFAQSLATDFHLIPLNAFTMGSDGVDVFFVISGFIMAYTTDGLGQRSATQFAWKRIVRILPLYWLLTLAVFALGVAAPMLLNSGAASTDELAKSLAFIPYERADGRVAPVLFLGWTLNYEMFFYAVFAGILLVAPRWRLQLLAIAMGALAAAGYLIPDQLGFFGTFYTNGIILEFVWGALLFAAWKRWPDVFRVISPVWLVGAGLLLVQNFVDVPLPREVEKGLPALIIVAGVLGLTVADNPVTRLFGRIGDASYSLYLGHPYAIGVCSKLALALLGSTMLGALFTGVASLVLATLAALLGYYLFEKPTNSYLRALLRPRRPACSAPIVPKA